MKLHSVSGLALLGAATTVHAISTISTYGNKFFYENGTQFFIKGVAYQLTEDDPLVDKTQCALDASLMQELGANSIRVYHVDASSDHSDCMTVFADAGIYLLVDLDTFDTYILPVWSVPRLSFVPNEKMPMLMLLPRYRIALGGTRPSMPGSPRLWMSFNSTTTPWV